MKKIRQLLSRLEAPRLRAALLLSSLLLLLTGLFWQTQVHSVGQHYQIIEQLQAIERSHLAIKADILKSYSSVFHNYDKLTADTSAFLSQLEALETSLSQLPPHFTIQEKLAEIEEQSALRDLQIEDFKSENAILKNSTTYFPTAMATIIDQLETENRFAPSIALLQQVSQLVLMYSLDNALAAPSDIRKLMAQAELPPITDNAFRHAAAILRLQGETHQLVSLLSDETLGAAINELTLNYKDYYREVTQTKNNYLICLFVVAVALVIYLGYLVRVEQNTRMLKAVNLRLSDAVNEQTQALTDAIAQLKRSQAQLVQAEKLSGLGQLSAGVAHEINNPISFIYGNIDINTDYTQDCLALISLYEKHYPKPAEEIQRFSQNIALDFLKQDWQKLLDSMKAGTSRVQKIVESLSNFSRLDESRYKSVNLHEGLDSSLLLLNYQLAGSSEGSSISVGKRYGQLPSVFCDARAINQVFISLLGNAIDALREKSSEDSFSPTLTIATYVEAAHAVVKITDNGVGISKADQEKIFDPFFTTKPVGKGTGLGLTVSYQTIVEAHHGRLSVASTLGEGTTFQIELPISS
ncbi:DAHL domain-containing protein [cf. Phormidesmis sp. LEGE 11477]|uniref:DAHL domain-containing protein n=1 Tax=cf. Phormidesmis sp. LEGE 11477 TaxID=1828680 RepID=UPI00188086DB|nr:DAHL domain-containing protein [cf. Phormidesmis sp. LEGE 11477]MBE9061440.1 hypothetical protein [cf. Phormidesmis sp. LEGE 11477]